MRSLLRNTNCKRCGEPLFRIDHIPFCSKCEKAATEQFAKMRPDLDKKLKLISERKTEE